MTEEQRKTKDRSPNFPFIGLAQALQRAQQFYNAEKRGSAPFKVAAEHWSYSPASSGAFQTTAALKSYGLMTDEDSGEKRSLRLTDLALRILLDQRPDSPDKPRLMRQAAMLPFVAAEVYEKWPGELPSRPSLHHFLVLERGFGEEKAHTVVKIIFENEELTKHGSTYVDSQAQETDNEGHSERMAAIMANTANPNEVSGIRQHPIPSIATGLSPLGQPWTKPERLAFGGAEIIINYSGKPPISVFKFIERYMSLRIEMFEEDATGGDSSHSLE